MAALLSCGLILQGCVFIYVLRSAWSESNTKVSPTFVENWVKNTLVMVGVAVGAAFLAPARFALFDFTTTMNAATQWVAWFLSQGVTLFNRHALQQRGTPSAPGAPPPGILGNPGPVEHAATAFMVLLALVAAVAVLILVVAVIVVFLKGEWRKRPGLLRALKLSIFSLGDLVAYTRTFFRALVSWLIHLLNWRNEDRAQTGRRRRPRGRRRSSKDDSVVDERLPGEYMRRLFVRFLRAAKEQGLRPRSDHTAYEFAGVVKAEVEGVDEDVELLAQRYLEARYGRRQVERSESLEQAWTRVAHGLRNRRNMRHRQDSHRG